MEIQNKIFNYAILLKQVKTRVALAQKKAIYAANEEMLTMYWDIGKLLFESQKLIGWGNNALEQLSNDLKNDYPKVKGFSPRNCRCMIQFYKEYNQELTIWQQPVAKLGEDNGQQVVAQLDDVNMQQPVAQISEEAFFSVPWGHHLYIISQCKDVNRAVFYLKKTVENGWSRAVLLNFLDTNLYERQGKAVNNFTRLLANPQSELAAQTLKDPYNFDFLTLDGEYRERELEQGLTQNVTRFLLELGTGFAFVGSQVPLQVGEDTLYPDLLFYHLELRCYVVVELKITKFKAEHLGQLGVYVSAVNHIKKKPTDNPTIGLLICKTKNNVMAQYALESTNQPIGISEYQLSKLMPENIQSQLPTIEDIEATLSDIKETKDFKKG